MDKYYAYALMMTFIYSIIGFINRNSNPENKQNLKSRIAWQKAVTTAMVDSGFAILFFSGLTHFYPEWPIVLRVAGAVFLAVFIAEAFVDSIKEKITKWKI